MAYISKAKEAALLLKELKEREERKAAFMKAVGGGYDEFLATKERYRVVKGGRGSKKSTTIALDIIYRMMSLNGANTVVIRQTGNTHKDSTFAQLKWAALKLGVYDKWKFIENPMEATYLPFKTKILFRGFDDPLKLTSMTVENGHLCFVWIEEAFELPEEKAFDTFNESIRGELPPHLWHQITISYNPWINSHWTKTRFWGAKCPPNVFRVTTTHKCNEFLSQADHDLIEALAETDPARYKVVGLGEYGMPGGTYFDEFRRDIHVIKPFPIPEHWHKYTTKDYGLDMLANYWIAIDPQNNGYIYKELHESNLIISAAAKRIKEVNGTDEIKIKYAPPDLDNRRQETGKSALDIFREHGEVCIKANNRRVDGWLAMKEWLAPYETVDEQTGEKKKTARLKIFDNCVNLIDSLEQAVKDETDPNDVATEPHEVTHSIDAIRYFCIMRQRPTPAQEKPLRDDFGIYKRRQTAEETFLGGELDESYFGG